MLINGIKFACNTCVKGHRSSTCNHMERPLFEIRKKGRPVTQCTFCRDLRKTRQIHIKCTCTDKSTQHCCSSLNKEEGISYSSLLQLEQKDALIQQQQKPQECTCHEQANKILLQGSHQQSPTSTTSATSRKSSFTSKRRSIQQDVMEDVQSFLFNQQDYCATSSPNSNTTPPISFNNNNAQELMVMSTTTTTDPDELTSLLNNVLNNKSVDMTRSTTNNSFSSSSSSIVNNNLFQQSQQQNRGSFTPSPPPIIIDNNTIQGESVVITITPLSTMEKENKPAVTRIVTCYYGQSCICPGCFVHPNNLSFNNIQQQSSCSSYYSSDDEDHHNMNYYSSLL